MEIESNGNSPIKSSGKHKFRPVPKTLEERKLERDKRKKRQARIIIRNLSYKTTEKNLQEHFSQYGALEEINLLKKADGKLVGCAFIQFQKINDAAKAILKTTGKELNGRIVHLDWAVGRDTYLKHSREISKHLQVPKLEIKDEPHDVHQIVDDTLNIGGITPSVEVKSEEEHDEYSDGENDDNGDESKHIKVEETKPKIRRSTNDVVEGCTVFIKNIPFDASNEDLQKVCKQFGPLYYAVITIDPISGHSKGTGFAKFLKKESTNMCLAAGTEFKLFDQVLDPHLALSRQDIHMKKAKETAKQPADSRNLYLAKEGLITSGSAAADEVSPGDMAKRLRLEQVKNQMLKNLNRFVSRDRLSIHNVPLAMDSIQLRKTIESQTKLKVKECRIMRENRPSIGQPLGKSKGFGFVSFKCHNDALMCLRKINNNPNIFGKNNRPIVSFTIEDKTVHNIKKKRLEKSREKNPLFQSKLSKQKMQKKAKKAGAKQPDSSTLDVKPNINKSTKKEHTKTAPKSIDNDDLPEYSGMPAQAGTGLYIRPKWKLKEQAFEHKKVVNAKKKEHRKIREEKNLQIEKKSIDRTKKKRKSGNEVDNFSFLVDKYKRMLDTDSESPAKKLKRSKWYVD